MQTISFRSSILLMLYLLAGAVAANGQTPLFQSRFFVGAEGDTLRYRISFPEGYDTTRQYPLLLFLHGSGERGKDNEAQLRHGASLFSDPVHRRQFPAIVVFPQCPEAEFWSDMEAGPGGNWTFPFRERPPRPQVLLMELLDQLQDQEAVDEKRLYLLGLSMGAFGIYDLLLRQPDRFAAAIPICGGGNLYLARLYSAQTPLWIFHGAKDEAVSVMLSRLMYRRLRELSIPARYTEYPQAGHNSWDSAFAEPQLLPWLFAQSRRPFSDRRFREPVFDSIEVRTFTYKLEGSDTLQLDLYLPAGDSMQASRPLLLYVHGGGFSGGQRNNSVLIEFAHQLGRLGYGVASISYRLTMKGQSFHCDQPAPNKIRTFQLAVEDIRRATNFLLASADSLGIDPARIVLAGSSAGAEAVLHAAYWQDRDLLPECPGLPTGFRYAGVIGMAGALVDDKLITAQTAIPTQLFHGTCDDLVPYANASHHYCPKRKPGFLPLSGSLSIAERLREEGRPFYLVSACNGGHEWNDKPLFDHVREIVDFLYHDVLEGSFRQIHQRYLQDGGCRKLIDLPVWCVLD